MVHMKATTTCSCAAGGSDMHAGCDRSAADLRASPRAKPRVLIADGHRIVAEGIACILAGEFDVSAPIMDGHALLSAADPRNVDVIVSEMTIPSISGLEVLKRLRANGSQTPFIFLTAHDEPAVAAMAMKAGANGYVSKEEVASTLIVVLRKVLRGEKYVARLNRKFDQTGKPFALTPRRREILELLASGLSNRQVARKLSLSIRTIEGYKYEMMQELHATSVVHLVRRARELCLLL
jgi:DNA-binding NarL/FixJ family response regulator